MKKHEGTPPPTFESYPPDICTLGNALDLAFELADETIGALHPDVADAWRVWLAQAKTLIKKELPPGIVAQTLTKLR